MYQDNQDIRPSKDSELFQMCVLVGCLLKAPVKISDVKMQILNVNK
jgi:hypothetical protein